MFGCIIRNFLIVEYVFEPINILTVDFLLLTGL